jgi:DNA-directed RNA polymerase specialized sigma24 family protein
MRKLTSHELGMARENAIIQYREVHGLTFKEIAGRLGVKPDYVRGTYAKALRRKTRKVEL